jgi:type IV pilus assembly protein PilB
MVLSTLHTNDAPGAVTRLLDLGVAPYLLSASLRGVLAQRLVRRICASCKTEYDPPATIKRIVAAEGGDVPKYYRGVGCKKCRNTGYAGRIAIHELFIPDDDILEMINEHLSAKRLRAEALEKGMIPLQRDGIEKVKAGIVSIEEILRTAVGDSGTV